MLRAAARGDPVADFAEVAHLVFDLTAEGFADTTAIGTLTDQTGNSRDATQATGTKQPLAQTVSGMKVARFDGADDGLQTAAFGTLSQPNTIIALVKSTATGQTPYVVDGLDSGSRNLIVVNADGNWLINAGSSITDGASDTSWHVLVGTFNSTASALFVDGGTAAVSGDAGADALTGLTVGIRYTFIRSWDGDIAYLGLYDGDLKTDDLTLLNNTCQALADRAGITWTDIT